MKIPILSRFIQPRASPKTACGGVHTVSFSAVPQAVKPLMKEQPCKLQPFTPVYFFKLNVDALLRGDYASRMQGY